LAFKFDQDETRRGVGLAAKAQKSLTPRARLAGLDAHRGIKDWASSFPSSMSAFRRTD